MKVAKQTQGDLLRGADAGRNGYETGMYDAFLACVQASARGVKLPPFTVGERLNVGGPMQVWKRTVGKLPFVGVDEAVIALPDVDAAEPCPVVVLTPVVGADSMECVEVDQDLQGGGDADQQSLDDSVATMTVDAVGVVGKVDQRAPAAVGGTNSGGLVDLSLDMSWLNDGLGQMEGWGRLVEIHGQRLAKATSEQFESARLLPVLCFMARALGEHAVLGNTVGSEGQGASFEQRDAEPSSGALDFGGVDPLDFPFGFEGIAGDGFQVVGQQSFVTTERVLRYAVDGLESNQVKYINLRRSVNSLLHDAATLGWVEQRSVKLEGGPRVNIWTFLPEGIEYVGTALLAREKTARVSRGIPMARICSELSVEEREERREVLKARRESMAKRGARASGPGKKAVVTRKELAESVSQGAIDKQRSRMHQSHYNYVVDTLLDPAKGKAWTVAPGGYLPMRWNPDGSGGMQLVTWTALSQERGGHRGKEGVVAIDFSNPNADPLTLYRNGMKTLQTPWYPVYVFNLSQAPSLVFVQHFGAYQAIYGPRWVTRPFDGDTPVIPSLVPKWQDYQPLGSKDMRTVMTNADNDFLPHLDWGYSVYFPNASSDPARLQKYNAPTIKLPGDYVSRAESGETLHTAAHSAAVRDFTKNDYDNSARSDATYNAFRLPPHRDWRRMGDGQVVGIGGAYTYLMLLPLNATTTGESLKQSLNYAPERKPMDIVTPTSLDLVNKLAVLLE